MGSNTEAQNMKISGNRSVSGNRIMTGREDRLRQRVRRARSRATLHTRIDARKSEAPQTTNWAATGIVRGR